MWSKTFIAGYLGVDPTLKYAQNGDAVCSFSVATGRKYKDKNGQEVDKTTWYRVSAWGRQAETCNEFLKKGSAVLVEGELQPDPSTGGPRVFQRKDGSWGASFELRMTSFAFLPKGEKHAEQTSDSGDEL